ncbi:MAG: HAD family phosphatase [Candidatus Aenigmarchaeota archaeon]|nr:HAD family phosphatase [Candidatus Aenigmarchaeota archaeon]
MIRAVIFDFGGVLTKGQLAAVFCRAVARKTGIPAARVRRAFKAQNGSYLTGRVSGKVFFDTFADTLGVRRDARGFFALFERSAVPRPTTLRMVRRLRPRYKLALLSDNYRELVQAIRPAMKKRFDVLVFSNEVGVTKPHPLMFRTALRALGLQARDCVFIDDKQENVRAARQLGIPAIRFTRADKLKSGLAKVGVRGV